MGEGRRPNSPVEEVCFHGVLSSIRHHPRCPPARTAPPCSIGNWRAVRKHRMLAALIREFGGSAVT